MQKDGEITNSGQYLSLWDQVGIEETDDQSTGSSSLILNSEEISSNSWFTCKRSLALKTAACVINLGVFGTSSYFLINEYFGSRSVKVFSAWALINGGTMAPFFHLLLSPDYRKKFNELLRGWTYEILLAFSQLELNLVPESQMKIFGVPFIWGFGALKVKDILALLSMEQPDLFISHEPPDQEKLIATLGFTTRNNSLLAKCWLGGMVVTGIGLTALNFCVADKYSNLGDYGKIGIYQDLIAMFSGSVIGDLSARMLDNFKEGVESTFAKQLMRSETPLTVKVMRVAKNAFALFTPVAIGTLLAVNPEPNSVPDYMCKLAVGGLYGANLLIARREFENPASSLHTVNVARQVQGAQQMTTCEKVKSIAIKYGPSVAFLGSLTTFMLWAAVTNLPLVDYAIAVLLGTTFLSFIFTDVLVGRCQPLQNNRFHNELNFRMIYASVALSIFFQYLTTKVEIGDQYLSSDSTALYALSLIAWFFWGINVGNNRAINMQRPAIPALPISPPIAMQELAKTFARNLGIGEI